MKHRTRFLRRQAGVGLVTAIFLLVVLAGLGVAMVSIYTTQQSTSNADLMGARAYQAARAGLEWGVFQVTRQDPPACQDVQSFRMPAGTSLSDFTVVIKCARDDGTALLTRYVITATACNKPDVKGLCLPVNRPEFNRPESVMRTLEAEI